FDDERWHRPMAVGDVVPAVVVAAPKSGPARLRIGGTEVPLDRAGYTWTRRTSAADLFQAGDLVEVEVTKLDEANRPVTVSLEQTPLAEGALLAIDNHTGGV